MPADREIKLGRVESDNGERIACPGLLPENLTRVKSLGFASGSA
jgi:hypothetical protein